MKSSKLSRWGGVARIHALGRCHPPVAVYVGFAMGEFVQGAFA